MLNITRICSAALFLMLFTLPAYAAGETKFDVPSWEKFKRFLREIGENAINFFSNPWIAFGTFVFVFILFKVWRGWGSPDGK